MAFRSEIRGDHLLIDSGSLWLEIHQDLSIRPFLKRADGRLATMVPEGALSRPAFQAGLGGFVVDAFRVDWSSVSEDRFDGASGPGRVLAFSARASQHGEAFYPSLEIEARVTLEFFEQLPLVVVGRAEFFNRGKQRLSIDRLVSFCQRLDRRLLDPGEQPWRFASYQGAAVRWGHDYSLVWIEADTARENFMGSEPLQPARGEGGGTPLVDLWAPGCGLALACAEPRPEWVSLPVTTHRDGLVELCLAQEPQARFGEQTVLDPGQSVATVRTALILHAGDFHDALRSYSELLRRQGVGLQRESSPACHAPYWKSWGFGLDFTQEQIFGALEEIRGFGIEMAMLDDGWFDWYGDWEPVRTPGKFPGGDQDMRRFVAQVKARGLRTSLWWYPQGVSPESRLAREHPDWLIENADGSRPACGRNLWYLCPEHPAAVEHLRALVRKILVDWDFDGLYLDTTGQSISPPCFNPAHRHASPLDSFRGYGLYRAVWETAQQLKPGCTVEMCICGLPHDPFKMPFYNVANTSDPVNLGQVRRRVKVEKALHGPSFCVGDCYQIPIQEWDQWSVPQSFESALGTGAQLTTLYSRLTAGQREQWKFWFGLYRELLLSRGEYLNLYDLAFDRPEAHVVRKDGRLYYGFFAERWPRLHPLALRGLEPGKRYRARNYVTGEELGEVDGDQPLLRQAFAGSLLLEVSAAE